jgi:hypothetical protein
VFLARSPLYAGLFNEKSETRTDEQRATSCVHHSDGQDEQREVQGTQGCNSFQSFSFFSRTHKKKIRMLHGAWSIFGPSLNQKQAKQMEKIHLETKHLLPHEKYI